MMENLGEKTLGHKAQLFQRKTPRVIFEIDLFWNKLTHVSLRAKEQAKRLKKIQKDLKDGRFVTRRFKKI
jgi:hypothetical protein